MMVDGINPFAVLSMRGSDIGQVSLLPCTQFYVVDMTRPWLKLVIYSLRRQRPPHESIIHSEVIALNC